MRLYSRRNALGNAIYPAVPPNYEGQAQSHAGSQQVHPASAR
jgi:hypothetical protein